MKRERNLACVWGSVLAFLLSFGAVGAMVTGMALDVKSVMGLALACAAFASGSALCFRIKRGGTVLLCILAVLSGFFWRQGSAGEQTMALLHRVCSLYDGAYGWGVPAFAQLYQGQNVDYPLMVIGCLVAIAVSWTVCRQKGAGIAILVAGLPMFSCFVVTDTVPDAPYLYIWMLGLLVLVLSGGVRRLDMSQGNSLTAMAAVAGAVGLGLLFWAVPREGYDNQPQELQDRIIAWVQELPDLWEDTTSEIVSNFDASVQPSELDLRDIGPKVKKVYPVMDVNAPKSGTIYLRGQDYDVYDGTGWTASWRRSEEFGESVLSSFVGEVHIQTRRTHAVLYIPYYSSAAVSLVGGRVDNGEDVKEYTFSQRILPENWKRTVSAMGDAAGNGGTYLTSGTAVHFENTQRYLTLPNGTKDWAEELVSQIVTSEQTATAVADAIADYVRSSADYDLDTSKMPSDRDDFARWFLEESDTGYCVHFATATTVLLRAAGVEARYVEGYMASAEAGEAVTVTADQAHAWAEYYEPLLDAWLMVESTPADQTDDVGTVVATETEESTQPESSEAELPTVRNDIETRPEGEPTDNAAKAETEELRLPNWLTDTLKWLLALILLVAAIHGQRHLRLRHRQDRQRRGKPNTRALRRWREVVRLYYLLKEDPPEEMELLAQKAKYSQHSISMEELKQLEGCIRAARQRLQERPWYQKLIDQYIFAAY